MHRIFLLLLLPLAIAGCKNCGVYETHSAGGVTVGERWTKPQSEVENYFCKVASWTGEPMANGASSYEANCLAEREFRADFKHAGKTYVAKVLNGVVVSLGRRSICIDP